MHNVDRPRPRQLHRAVAVAVAAILAAALPVAAHAQRAQTRLPPANAPANPPAAANANTDDRQALLDRIEDLERRLTALESTAVLSAPKVLVKEIKVWVDENGNQYDHEVPGAREVTTYQRELAQRRQTIEDEISDKLAEESANSIQVGVNNVTTIQAAHQLKGAETQADGHMYGLTAADVTFSAKSAALNTEFFADLVGIGGSPPEQEINALNLLNGQTARLSNNQLSVREAWLRTEVAHQRIGISVGRLDVTTHFDRNVAANDETTQFISDALVNNPVLGLAGNGFGIVTEFDPKKSFNFKLGVQQSTDDPNATPGSLHNGLFTLAEAEYVARPFSLPEGHYRLWYRSDNGSGEQRSAYGLSVDQKISASITLFGRYGNGYVSDIPGREKFYSGGVQFGAPHTLHPNDYWGIGLAHSDFDLGPSENLAEGYYNLYLTGHLRASFMLQYVKESSTGDSYLLPGARVQVVF